MLCAGAEQLCQVRLPALIPVLTTPAVPGRVFGNILVILQKPAVPQTLQMVTLGKQRLRWITLPILLPSLQLFEFVLIPGGLCDLGQKRMVQMFKTKIEKALSSLV